MLRYLGGGFIVGVPARDLTNEEAEQHGVNNLILSGLYLLEEPARQPEMEETAEPETDEPDEEE